MADAQPIGTIDIEQLLAEVNAAAARNRANAAIAKRNSEVRTIAARNKEAIRGFGILSNQLATQASELKAQIINQLSLVTAGTMKAATLRTSVEKYNAIVIDQAKYIKNINDISTGVLSIDKNNKLKKTGIAAPPNAEKLQSGPKPGETVVPGEIILGQGKPQVSINSTGKVITNKGALKETGNQVQGPATGTSTGSLEQYLATMRANVAKSDSPEYIANEIADAGPGAFANWASKQIALWSGQVGDDPRMSKWQEIQTILRASGRSKGTTSLDMVDNKDIEALKNAFKEAKASGTYIDYFLNKDYQFRQANGTLPGSGSGGGMTKTLVSSLRLLDSGDASNKLSTAYYKAYGRYPTQKQLTSFKDQWNQEAKVQMAQTASYRSKDMSKDITTGEGFTDLEQSDFLNRYLAKQFKINFADLGGDTKKIYDDIRSIYRDNMLPEPEFAQVASIVKDLIGTADANVYNTKIAQVKQTVGKQAAAFYPSIEKELLNGDSVETFASVYRSTLSQKWGVSAESLKQDQEAQDLIKNAVNFKGPDNKPRMMDNNEFNALVQSTKRWKASEQAFTSYSNIGDKLIAAFNLQGGVR